MVERCDEVEGYYTVLFNKFYNLGRTETKINYFGFSFVYV